MTTISGLLDSSLLGSTLTPEQQAAQALLGGAAGTSAGARQTPAQGAEAALVGLSAAAARAGSAAGAQAATQVPSATIASLLVSAVAAEISSPGPTAASVYSLLSASETYLLTRA